MLLRQFLASRTTPLRYTKDKRAICRRHLRYHSVDRTWDRVQLATATQQPNNAGRQGRTFPGAAVVFWRYLCCYPTGVFGQAPMLPDDSAPWRSASQIRSTIQVQQYSQTFCMKSEYLHSRL